MNRLTQRDEYGNADIIALSDVMPELYASLSFSETNALTEALNRLGKYEDTGFTPEEIEKLKKELYLTDTYVCKPKESDDNERKEREAIPYCGAHMIDE